MKFTKLFLALGALAAWSFGAQAQILVNSGVNPTITFGAAPVLTVDQWAWHTNLAADGAATFANPGQVDTAMQNLNVSVFNNAYNALPVATAYATSRFVRHNTAAGRIAFQPTGVAANVLRAALRNNSGGTFSQLQVTYDYDNLGGIPGSGSEATEVPGLRAYFSTTGVANSWTVVPSLSVTTAGSLSATFTGLSWASGTDVYLVWVDDNAATNPDGTNTIDNVVFTGVGSETCVAITNQPVASLLVPERGAATFSLIATGAPQNIQWQASRDGGVTFTNIPGATASSYTLASAAYPGDNNARFRAYVSNSTCNVTSTATTLTVTPDSTRPTVISAVGSSDLLTVTVTFSEPIKPADAYFGNFSVYPSGGDAVVDDLGVNDPVTFVNGTNVILTTASARTPGVNYSLRVSDVHDNSSQQNLINPNPTDVQFIVQDALLIGFAANNVWKFGTLSNHFDTIPAGWETVAFDDSAWPSGPAGLGHDASVNGVPINTETGYSSNSVPTFFRRHFNLPAGTNGLTLNMRYVFEDGAVIYLNGQEAARINVAAATVINAAARSAAAAADPTPVAGPVALPLSNVFPGDNVIAVVVLQSGAGSSDIEMAIELTAVIPQYPSGPVVIETQPASSTTVNEGQPFTLGVGASGAIPITYQWRKGGVNIVGQTGPTLTVAAAVPGNTGAYTVAVSNSLGGLISATANVTVIADTTAPVILSAIGETNLSVVTVTLYDASGIDLPSANTAGNYQVKLTAGGPNLGVTSAVAANVGTNTVVTLTTTSPRAAGQNYTLTISGVTDVASAHTPVSPNTHAITATEVLFPFNHVWRYQADGTDPGPTWKDTGFADGAWATGAGILGFETTAATLTLLNTLAPPNGTNTILSLTNSTGAGLGGTNAAFYFRTTVNISSFDPAQATFTMRAYIDDGAILYINGVERFRYNLTNGPGNLTLANAALTETAQTYIVSNLTGFVQGNNVIAVEVHQDAIGSSDIDWGMQLEALIPTYVPLGPRVEITNNGNGTVTLSVAPGVTGHLWSTADPGNPRSGGGWTDEGPISNASPVTRISPGTARFYEVRVP